MMTFASLLLAGWSLAALVSWLLFAVAAGLSASAKGRNVPIWCLIGLLFGPMGLLLILVSRKLTPTYVVVVSGNTYPVAAISPPPGHRISPSTNRLIVLALGIIVILMLLALYGHQPAVTIGM